MPSGVPVSAGKVYYFAATLASACEAETAPFAQNYHRLMSDFLQTCVTAARAGGEILMQWRGRISTREKAPGDLVTEADLASQQRIQQVLHDAYPDHEFLGEETPASQRDLQRRGAARFVWIVDPLDGTTNYVHGLQSFAVSVALLCRKKIVAAAVFDPWLNELYTATPDKGAELNARPISVSQCAKIAEALVVTSFPPRADGRSIEVRRFVAALPHVQSIRRLGSASLNLCYLAAGRIDAYWATSLNAWDVAAGALIVQQAGGIIRDIDDRPFDLFRPRMLAAASQALWRQVHCVIASVDESDAGP